MGTYDNENQVILDLLQKQVHTEEIHGLAMEVKEIPDPIEKTVLDPRVYKTRKADEEKGNPWAECLEIPVELIRQDPGYPNKNIAENEIVTKEQQITTRNGATPIFIYQPLKESKKLRPAMLFFHGGAFIAGSTKVVENFCRLLADMADMVVIGVDYCLAPEYHFPAGLYDCYDALNWTYEHATELGIDRNKLSVGGDSAGGTLAIGCAILERDAVKAGELSQSRISYQALLYPGVLVDNFKLDDYKWKMSDYQIPEDDLLAMGAALSLKAMTAEMPYLYMGVDGHVKDPLAAPLCQESLAGLPETLLVLCEYDYLRLSGEAFGRKLVRDEVALRTILYRGMDHAFIDKIGDYPQAYDLAMEIAKDVRRVCGN